jgi:hypothetical protein
LAHDLSTRGTHQIVIELDESMLRHDKRTMYDATRKIVDGPAPRDDWKRAHEDPLLWTADAVAWCWSPPVVGGAFVSVASPNTSKSEKREAPLTSHSGWLRGSLPQATALG